MHHQLRICALLLLPALSGCRKEADSDAHHEREASVAVEASAPVDASTGDAWPTLDEAQHCASLRRIAGAMDVVPSWRPDAGFPPPALDVPSGFGSCKGASFPERQSASLNWYAGHECLAPPAPNEEAGAARFRELAAIWRRCLTSSGLVESATARPGPRRVDFRKPAPPSGSTACSLYEAGATLRMACYRSGNN